MELFKAGWVVCLTAALLNRHHVVTLLITKKKPNTSLTMTGNRESNCCVLRWHTCLLFVSLPLLFLHLFILTGSSPLHPISNVSRVSADACDVILQPIGRIVCPILYLSSSISRLDSELQNRDVSQAKVKYLPTLCHNLKV